MSKIEKEVAKSDLNRFIDKFKIDSIKLEKLGKKRANERGEEIPSLIDFCIQLIMEGLLVVNENDQLEYELLEAVEDSSNKPIIEKLIFKNRRVRLENITSMKACNDEAKMKKLIAICTGCDEPMVSKMTMDDLGYVSDLSLFFLPAQ